MFKSVVRKSLIFFMFFTLVCGVLWTAVLTLIGESVFHDRATGSIVTAADGIAYGSALLGQSFDDMNHLWGRPQKLDISSFASEDGSLLFYAWPTNLTPVGEAEAEAVAARAERLQSAHPEMAGVPVPEDLVTVSGSGLDPEISPEAAEYQVKRLSRTTGRSEAEIRRIIDENTRGRFLGLFGEPGVNVLGVNLALDGIETK